MQEEPASILFWATPTGDDEHTAELVPFPGATEVVAWLGCGPVDVPAKIYFEANARSLRELDYPDNDVTWPLMSERMRRILLPHAAEHRVIPVSMVDDTLPDARRLVDTIEGYAAVQIAELTDAMDMDLSEYTPHHRFPGRAGRVTKLVFKDVPLPSLFRLSTFPSPLFVSAAARRELQAAGIKGMVFLSVDDLP